MPGLHCNLLSLSKAMKIFKLSGKDNQLKLKFKNLEYSFNHKIKSGTGFLFGLKVVTGKGNTMVPYKKGHMFLTHANEVTTKATMTAFCLAQLPLPFVSVGLTNRAPPTEQKLLALSLILYIRNSERDQGTERYEYSTSGLYFVPNIPRKRGRTADTYTAVASTVGGLGDTFAGGDGTRYC